MIAIEAWRAVRLGAIAAAGAALAAVPAAAAAKAYVVPIRNMAFGPVPSDLRVGDTIEWINDDIFQHTVTATDKSFDLDLAPKAHATIAIRKPGTIYIYCRYHPGMKARIVARPQHRR
ncbi:MAG TPA: cupredoxin domain-containing protein [Sphingomonas sp.]|nr:cupredoxin domain-containing protein [Sphingomonas sp.]